MRCYGSIKDSQCRFAVSRTRSQVVNLFTIFFCFLLPKRQVLLEELDDALGVAELILIERIDLVESLLEGFVGQFASSRVVLHDFVVEDREVEGETELDWVAWWKFNSVGLVVSLESLLLDTLELLRLGVLGDVAVVVTNHLDEEGSGLIGA